MSMNIDKAYLLGLIIGGGIFGEAEDVFKVRLPFKKWGSYIENPERAGKISNDIMKVVNPMFRNVYNLTVYFDTSGNVWNILCDGDATDMKADLAYYGIPCVGELRASANISKLCTELVDDNLKRRFVAGLADSIGSMAKSQRRFSDDNQILSLEIKGFNFEFVCELCRLLHSINCIPDQVNWNHPNIHCTNDPYYPSWNKGFKLRILLDQYAEFGAFAFRTKAESSKENRRLQQQIHVAQPCSEKRIAVTPSCMHPAENDVRLPEQIRGGHYIHYQHFCAVLGCEHAASDKILSHFSRLGELVTPFAIQCKDSIERIEAIIANDPLLARRNYTDIDMRISLLLGSFHSNNDARLYATDYENGYPIKEVLQAIAYVIADEDELFGKRPKGYMSVIEHHIQKTPLISVRFRKPDLLTPLVIVGKERAVLVGPVNPRVYEKLITHSPDNKFKLIVRPITEEDLLDA
jgi:hypothetical protein